MTSKIKVKNLSRLERKLKALPLKVQKPVKQEVYFAALQVQGTAVKRIQRGTRSGVVYSRGGKTAQRSAPGEYPKTDRGKLVSSIFAKPIRGMSKFSYEVGTKLKYGVSLELGTRKMAPRPWLFPSFRDHVKEIKKNIQKAVNKALRSKTR